MNMLNLTISHASDMLGKKEISAYELAKAHLEHIEKTETIIRSFTQIDVEKTLEFAVSADRMIRESVSTPLTGIPMGIKDNIFVKDWKTTCASRSLGNFQAVFDATCIKRLKSQGAVIIGKTNLDEFAMGSSTETSAFYKTANPWNYDYIPGGSSGGSAACVAANQAICALGSDTGGSVRQPASFCGVTGIKPTYGRISRQGLAAFASSLDQIGTLTKDVVDAALLLDVLCGPDKSDSTTAHLPAAFFRQNLKAGIKGLRIGVPDEYYITGMDYQIADILHNSLKELEKQGAILKNISLPHTKYALPTYYVISSGEGSTSLARIDGVKYGLRTSGSDWGQEMETSRAEGLGPEVKKRILFGTFVLSANNYQDWYVKAQSVRTLIKQDFAEAFKDVNIIATPTSPRLPYKIGTVFENPAEKFQANMCAMPVNLAGLPAISVPCGFATNLPVGMQLIGRAFDEQTILNTAHTFQQITSFHLQKPLIAKI